MDFLPPLQQSTGNVKLKYVFQIEGSKDKKNLLLHSRHLKSPMKVEDPLHKNMIPLHFNTFIYNININPGWQNALSQIFVL